MPLSNFKTYKLTSSTELGDFDCEDEDLNDFYIKKCKDYQSKLLATTFVIFDPEKKATVAFFSILNDNLLVEESKFVSKSEWRRFKKIMPHPKRFLNSYPALKIGRLAVSKDYKGLGIGRAILDVITMIAIKANDHHACKFITLDAYSKSLKFYEKNDFKYLTESDSKSDTRQMYYDLTPFYHEIVVEAS